jgi:uncharacterized membrane protein
VRVVLPWIDLNGLLNTATEQIRTYATTDAAVSLRLLRLPHDMAVSVEDVALHRHFAERGARKSRAAAAASQQRPWTTGAISGGA